MKGYGLQRAIFPLITVLLLICIVNGGFCAEKGGGRRKSSSMQISGSGASADDPIVIKGVSGESEGIRMEYKILKNRFPKCLGISQHLIQHKDRPTDVIRIRLANGSERDVFFDVSDFFGKMSPASGSPK